MITFKKNLPAILHALSGSVIERLHILNLTDAFSQPDLKNDSGVVPNKIFLANTGVHRRLTLGMRVALAATLIARRTSSAFVKRRSRQLDTVPFQEILCEGIQSPLRE